MPLPVRSATQIARVGPVVGTEVGLANRPSPRPCQYAQRVRTGIERHDLGRAPAGAGVAAATPTVPSWLKRESVRSVGASNHRGKPHAGAIKRRLAEPAVSQVQDHLDLAGRLIRQQDIGADRPD